MALVATTARAVPKSGLLPAPRPYVVDTGAARGPRRARPSTAVIEATQQARLHAQLMPAIHDAVLHSMP